MKALLISQIYPTLRQPTRGSFNNNVFRALSSFDEVCVISPQPFWQRLRHPQELCRVPQEHQTGLNTFLPTYWSVPKMPHLHGKGLYASLRPFVTQLRKEFSFEVILAAWAYPDAFAALRLARDFDVPLVIKTLGSDINEMPLHPKLRPQIVEALQGAQRIVTVSKALRDRVVELGATPERVAVQHNGVNGDVFRVRDRDEVRAQLGINTERAAFCYVGRLSQEKGVDILLQAMHYLNQTKHIDADLHLVGGGSHESILREMAAAKGMRNVYFHGTRSHQEVPLWLSACDVFCLPSRREGCPNVILEALASGKPVVASAVGGVPELIGKNNGILVAPENPQALAEGLRQAAERAWNAQEQRDSVEFLSWDAVGTMYHQTLAAAVQDKAQAALRSRAACLPGSATRGAA